MPGVHRISGWRMAKIAGDLRQYQALGIRSFNVNLPGADIAQQSEAMDRFMREVAPLVA